MGIGALQQILAESLDEIAKDRTYQQNSEMKQTFKKIFTVMTWLYRMFHLNWIFLTETAYIDHITSEKKYFQKKKEKVETSRVTFVMSHFL